MPILSPKSHDSFLLEEAVQQRTGLSRTTRWRLEKKGKFPKRRQISPGRVGWRSSEILEWINSRELADGGDQ